MASIITVTINPCIDKSSSIEKIIPEKKLRCAVPKYEPGGGGINVSRVIKKLGGHSIPVLTAGGHSGKFLINLIEDEKLEPLTIQIKENTRENFIVYEESTNNQYRFGMPGPLLSNSEWQACINVIESLENVEYIVASGSLPRGVPVDFFARLAKVAKQKNTRYILDTSGEAVKHALNEGVYLWKPNLGELSAFSGYAALTVNTAVEAARKIIAQKKAVVIVLSMGAAGAMLITENIAERIIAPVVKRKSTVGAGDSMVAGIVYSLSKGIDLTEAVKFGVACGTAATMNAGTELCKKEDAEKLYKSY
jgi:6-phosphofructokinase 2